MPTNRTPLRRDRRGKLNSDQELELWLGPRGSESVFADRDELEETWTRHRARLMDMFAHNGRRPAGWWEFEALIPFPGHDRECSTLFELGELTDAEMAELIRFWRAEFEKASKPGFVHCEGEKGWLRGAAARTAHYAWADVPASLVKRWSAERRSA